MPGATRCTGITGGGNTMMKRKTAAEESILREVADLPAADLQKVLRIMRVRRREILRPAADAAAPAERFMALSGSWRDKRSVKQQVRDVRRNRRSEVRQETLR
jgi:hypothetical protein